MMVAHLTHRGTATVTSIAVRLPFPVPLIDQGRVSRSRRESAEEMKSGGLEHLTLEETHFLFNLFFSVSLFKSKERGAIKGTAIYAPRGLGQVLYNEDDVTHAPYF